MNEKQKQIEQLKRVFLIKFIENRKNPTRFDCAVIDTLTELQGRFADDSAKGYIL